MEDNNKRKSTAEEQKRIKVMNILIDWAREKIEDRSVIVIAVSGNAFSCAVIGNNDVLIPAFVSALQETPALKTVMAQARLVDIMSRGK